jgi:hypothetical protein
VTLPFVLWNWDAFMRSAVTLQMKQPLREDALSFLIWAYWHVDKEMARGMGWVAFAGAGVFTGLSLWLWPRNGGGFAGAVAMVFFAFFSLNRQAFTNYYFFVIAAMCCAIAAVDASTKDTNFLSTKDTKEHQEEQAVGSVAPAV